MGTIRGMLAVCAFALALAGSVHAATVCDGLTGGARGLCNAYCVAQKCNTRPHPSCDSLRKNFLKLTGSALFPCDATPTPARTPTAPPTPTPTPTATPTETPSHCGNGTLDPGEQCDPPNSLCRDGQACRADCTCPPLLCGNGVVDPGEGCDPPNSPCPGGEACDLSCQCPECCEVITTNGIEFCFDTEHREKCQLLGGQIVPGVCDPELMRCTTNLNPPPVPFCCECPGPPPFPSLCLDSADESKCVALGCTPVQGATCDACSERCTVPDEPPLPAGTDTFPSTAAITLNIFPNPCGVPVGMHMINLMSPPGMETIVRRGPQMGDMIPTEIVQLELTGMTPLGPIMVLQNPDPMMRSMGMIENVKQGTAGEFRSGDSFFDVFVMLDLETPGCGMLMLHNSQAVRMQANCITSLPPSASTGGECAYTPPPAPGQPLIINGTEIQVGTLEHAEHLAGGQECRPPGT